MDSLESSNLVKHSFDEISNFKKMEIVQFYNYNPKKTISKKYKDIFLILSLLFLLILSILGLYYINKPSNKNNYYRIEKFQSQNEKKFEEKELNKKEDASKQIPTEKEIKKEEPPKKEGIGFLYPYLTRYMITTGEYFLKLNEYKIFFLTKFHLAKEPKFNNYITRINTNDDKAIEKAIKENNIKYLIINDVFKKNEIKQLKSLGVKLIGVFDDIYKSNNIKTSRNWKNIKLYDAFIQDSQNDYNYFKKNDVNRNIFIPNIYDTKKVKLSSLNNQNILLLGKFNDDKKGIISAINAMGSIIKEFPNARLNIISPDSQTIQINQLIKDLHLIKNIIFLPFSTEISSYCVDSSIFIYTTLIENCNTPILEAMDHGLPCIINSDISKDLLIKDAIINIDISKQGELGKNIIKLLKDSKYKNKMGMGSKLSLEKINEDALKIWEKLFTSLKRGEKDFQKLIIENNIFYNKKYKINHSTKDNKNDSSKKHKSDSHEKKEHHTKDNKIDSSNAHKSNSQKEKKNSAQENIKKHHHKK